MKNFKLTDWIDGDIKPTLAGVYERSYYNISSVRLFCYWDGKKWFGCVYSVESAAKVTLESDFQSLPWRGLAKEPK